MRRIAVVVAVAATAFAVMAATAPHPWAGRLWCNVQGGEWTNRFSSGFDEIVTAGYTCVK